MASKREADAAIVQLTDTELKGRLVFVREDRESSGDSGSIHRLYVGNLAWDIAWQDLKDHFKQVGNVVRLECIL